MHGSHALKFGVDITREQNNDNESGAERPNYQFRGLLNFANDACCFDEKVAVDGRTGGLPNGQRYFRSAAYSLFVQDDWKIRPNLTVNLGLRWEYFPPVTEAQGVLSNYIFGTQGFINGGVKVVSQLYSADKNNFGPRVGFAYSPSPWGHKTVLRGGFGILYDRPARTLPSLRKRAFAASSTQGQSSVLRQVPIFNMHWVAADWLTAIPLIQVLLSAWLPTGPSAAIPHVLV